MEISEELIRTELELLVKGDNTLEETIIELVAYIKWRDEAINYTQCSIQLLCVNKEDDNSITKGYEYKCIEKDKTHYKIIDNYSYEGWFPKKLFKELK